MKHSETFTTQVDKLFSVAGFSENTLAAVVNYFNYGGDIKINKEMRCASYLSENLNSFSTALFSTVNILPSLTVTIKFFLACEKYNELYEIMRLSTITDAYTTSKYVSCGDFSFEERSFDRFIRIIQTINLLPSEYMAFMCYLLDASNEPCATWSRPVKEFLKTQEPRFLSSYAESTKSINALQILLEIQSEKTVEKIVNHILFGAGDRTKFFPLLNGYKWLATPIALEHLSESNNFIREQAVKILLLFKSDERVSMRLFELYDVESVVRIKQLIGVAYGISEEVLKLNNFAELIAYARKVNVQSPKRFPELRYKNGAVVSSEVAGAMLTLLDNGKCALSKLLEVKEISKFMDEQSLADCAEEIYPHNDYARLAFSLLFGGEHIVKEEVDRQRDLLPSYDFNTRKFMMLGLSSSACVRAFLYWVISCDEHKKYHKHAQSALELASLSSGLSLDDIEDENSPTLGLDQNCTKQGNYDIIRVLPNLSVECDNREAELGKEIEQEIKRQAKRLETAMIEGRKFSVSCFLRYIINHPLLNKIASTLFFGEFKYGVLKNIFIVEGSVMDLNNQPYTPSSECDIMVCHSLDLHEKFGNRKFNITQPFLQAGRPFFVPANTELSKNCVERFSSILLNVNEVFKQAKLHGFSLGQADEKGAVGYMGKQFGEITVIVSFKNAIYPDKSTVLTLGDIRYYMGTSVKGFSSKARQMQLQNVNSRIFSESVYEVSKITSTSH